MAMSGDSPPATSVGLRQVYWPIREDQAFHPGHFDIFAVNFVCNSEGFVRFWKAATKLDD